MKKSVPLISIVILCFNITFSQCNLNWSTPKKDFGSLFNIFTKLTSDKDGNVYVLTSLAHYNVSIPQNLITKYNSYGDSLWTFSYIDNNLKEANVQNVLIDSAGNNIFGGNLYTNTNDTSDYFLIKIDKNGNKLWQTNGSIHNYDYLENIYFDNNQDILLLSRRYKIESKLRKINKDGVTVWEHLFPQDSLLDLAVDLKNHIHVLARDQIIELTENGTLVDSVLIPSIKLKPKYVGFAQGKIKLLEDGNDIKYVLFVLDNFNEYALVETDHIGNVLIEQHSIKSTIGAEIFNGPYLELTPSKEIIFGGFVDTLNFEGSTSGNWSTAFSFLNTDGSTKFKKNLYSKGSIRVLTVNDNYIFSSGVALKGRDIDIHNFEGTRICDAIHFDFVDVPQFIIPGKGSEFYLLMDNHDEPEKHFYKLQKYNDVNSATNESLNKEVKVFPNPGSQLISFNGLNKDKEYNYSIINLMGTINSKGKISNEDNINVENLANGIYFINIENGDNSQVLKFVKE